MPTIPLYSPAAHPDAWHCVQSPGGYEWWHFEARDVANDRWLAATLYWGCVRDPRYVRRFRRYMTSPTRHAPPLPGDFIRAEFAIYEAGRIRDAFVSTPPSSEFSASSEGLDLQVGPNRLQRREDGTLLLSVSGPGVIDGETLSAELAFRPRTLSVPREDAFLPGSLARAKHRWIVRSSLADVEGEAKFSTSKSEKISFRGVGDHDQHFGTGPFDVGLKRWF